MVMSNVGDDHYFSTALKIHFYTGIVIFLGHRPKPLRFFTVWKRRILVRHCCCVLARCLGKETKMLFPLTLLNYIFGALNFSNTYVKENPLPGNDIRILSKTESSSYMPWMTIGGFHHII
jgi:hypothetical protein